MNKKTTKTWETKRRFDSSICSEVRGRAEVGWGGPCYSADLGHDSEFLISCVLHMWLLISWNALMCICEWSSRVWLQIQSGWCLLHNSKKPKCGYSLIKIWINIQTGGFSRRSHANVAADGAAVNLQSPGVRLQQPICHGSSFTHLRTTMATLQTTTLTFGCLVYPGRSIWPTAALRVKP